jgi:hypothetical protein
LDKSRSLKNKKLYVRALDNILEAMRDLRIFDRFGFDLPKQVKRQASKIVISTNYDVWVFDPKSHDWINTETGLYYSTYTMTPELIDLFKNRIDFVLE